MRPRRPRGGIPGPRRGDVVAGATVALLLVPQSIALAGVAGMPAVHGLYAATIPLIVAAPLASSPYLQTGPVALTAVLTFGALAGRAPLGSDRYVALGLLLALLVGAMRLAIGLLRAGAVAHLLSRPLLMGFVPASAIVIVVSQLPAALGAPDGGDGPLDAAATALSHPAAWSATAILLTAIALALVLGGRRLHPRFPFVGVVVVAATAWSAWSGYGGAVTGPISAGLPPLSLSLPWADTVALLLPALAIALIGFAEPASIAQTYAARERQRWDPDREFVAQGAANVAAAVAGGMPVGGSFGRSALNHASGAQTVWSGGLTGLFVMALLPLVGLLADLPAAVLAALVVAGVAPLIRVMPAVDLWRCSRPAVAIATCTFAVTLAAAPHVEWGVLAGLLLSVVVHLRRELEVDAVIWEDGGVLHVRPRGVLWFGSAQTLERTLLDALADHPRAVALRLHLGAIGRLDVTAALTLQAVLEDLRRGGVEIELRDVQPRDRRLVDALLQPAGGG